jgi:predicted lipoprotein with Yx(FWY)xxD motif
MRNRCWAAGGLAAIALAAAACGTSPYGSSGTGSASGSPSGMAAAPSSSAVMVTLKAVPTSGGTILASAGGYTLYFFTGDKPGSGTSACTGSCASVWPPLTGTVQAPPGVTLPGPLGTITRADGTKQVTIKGYPIYIYNGDHAPGQVNGNGVGGKWHVVKISGSPSSSSSPSSPSSSSPSSGAGGYGGGGGY